MICGACNRRWPLAVGIVVVVVVALGLLSRGKGTTERTAAAGPVLHVAPSAPRNDAGPTLVVGAASDPNGTQFASADLLVDGPGDCRVYFDRRDNATFHFLDRVGVNVSLGLAEAGVEQILASGKVESTAQLRLARHGAHIGLIQQGKLVIAAFDDRLTDGSAGVRMLDGGQPVSLKVEPREDVHFADDFMATKKGEQWRGNGSPQKGDFNPESLRNPLLSANAFCYMGAGASVHSVVGQAWWDRYCYEAALRGPVGGSIGLVFAYQDERTFGLFRWTARKLGPDGAMVEPGKRELVRVRDGTEVVLAQAAGGYVPNQWYSARMLVTYSRVSVAIDGHPLMEASDPCLVCGGAGVWCDVPLPATAAVAPRAQPFAVNSLEEMMRQHAVFDDIRINTLDGYEDEFRTPGTLAGGWLVGAGDWSVGVEPNGNGAGELRVSAPAGSTKALIGDRRWSQYEVEAHVQPGGAAAGLVFLHRDESNYYAAMVEGGLLKLVSVTDGQTTVVDNAPIEQAAGPVRLKASIRHGHVRVTANDTVSVETFAGEGMLRGRAGFAASGRGQCAFSHFRLAFLPEREPLVTTNAIFEDELTMNDWTSPTSEWYPPREPLTVDGKLVNLLWHRSQFPGDVELMVEPREFTDAKDPKFEIALSVAKDGQGKNNGYVFRYKSGDGADGASRACTLQLIRQGELKTEKVLPEDPRQLSSVAMRRCGKYIVGVINGKPAIQYRDDGPLTGNKVAYYTQGVVLRSEATKITSDNFRNDFFSKAPTAWRIAGAAIAEVTNRWQCDPRWSFFSLKNERGKGKPPAAVLWSKYLYPGDVTVEFFVGNKMEGERGQPYTYARDINVTICSDGADLNKGYTFMWGGHANAGSMILRNGVEVKRHGARIPTDMNYHRYWFSYKVEKQGGKITFRVDRMFAGDSKQSELVYEDTQPLQGNHVAIWTYDHAIMLSRVRISGDGGNVAEEPDGQLEPLKTPYDPK